MVTDLEWIYGLELPHTEGTSKKKLRGIHGSAFRRKVARPDPGMAPRKGPSSPSAALLNIVYISMMAEALPLTEAQVVALGEQCRRDNGPRGVTGFLLCTRPFFLQCLEGPPLAVKEVFLKVYRDPRHRHVTVLAFRHIRQRAFGTWAMHTMDLDAEVQQDGAPLREVLLLLTRHFANLQAWLMRVHHDLLLSWVHLRPRAHAQCAIVAFAALRRRPPAPDGPPTPTASGASLPPSPAPPPPSLLPLLSPFLALGGELLGFLGDHAVGYTFAASQAVLLDEVVDLCALCDAHVGVAVGPMLLLNTDADDCDVAFFGPVFEKARALADRAASLDAAILAESACQLEVAGVVWESLGAVAVGRLDPYLARQRSPSECAP